MIKLVITFCMWIVFSPLFCQTPEQLDQKVRDFLDQQRGKWSDLNIPESDGKVLYDIIVSNNYQKALEIGTSTGHSTIWMAWALSKTGGKLITIEIDERRYKIAKDNIRKAGLGPFVDARLADAHQLVPALQGPFDFVFSDADKSWYKNYFLAVDPKLLPGGCYTTHNVNNTQNVAYLQFLQGLENYETTVNDDGAGMSISYKKAD